MTTDEDDNTAHPIGPDGQPLLGLIDVRAKTLPIEPRREPRKREMPAALNYRPNGKLKIDPLDKAAQDARGRKAEDVRLDEPLPADAYDNQIVWCVIGRVDGGPWSHLIAAENMRSATFPSKRRAEATMLWFRRQAEADSNGCEYRVVPIMRGEKPI